jgi:hypothetical protein
MIPFLKIVWAFLSGPIGGFLSRHATIIAVAFGVRKMTKDKAKLDGLKADAKTQERMNDADTGIGATDAATAKWLRDFADKHGKR